MEDEDASALIDAKIASLTDWRGATLAKLRALIREADPEIEEAVKWRKPTNPAGVRASASSTPRSAAVGLQDFTERSSSAPMSTGPGARAILPSVPRCAYPRPQPGLAVI